MSFTSYFDLEIEGRESYWHVRVHDSPGGHGEERVSQRKVEAALQERFRDLLAAVGSTGGSNRLPSKLDIERFGTWLFKAFFVGSVRTAWQGSVPREMGRELQLRLRLDRAPALARLPWEALATARGFLALDEGASIVRYPRVEGGTASGPG